MHEPLILTLALDPPTQAHFEALRQRWFPPDRNLIPAHVTLFHHLPGDRLADLQDDLAQSRPGETAAVQVTGLRFLGRGVAYSLEVPVIAAWRAAFARRWAEALTAQDQQPWRPHVTVQNKAAPDEARALHAQLAGEFAPFAALAIGCTLWRYLGGPWRREADFLFRSKGEEGLPF